MVVAGMYERATVQRQQPQVALLMSSAGLPIFIDDVLREQAVFAPGEYYEMTVQFKRRECYLHFYWYWAAFGPDNSHAHMNSLQTGGARNQSICAKSIKQEE